VPPPSRHLGSRVVSRAPNLIRTVTAIRDTAAANTTRIKREDVTFAPADWTRGEPATSATMASTHVTRVYRSGHSLYVDVAAGLGDASIVSAQLAVPDLGVIGPAVTSGEGGVEQDLRLQLSMPTPWEIGAVYRVYVQAMRVSGADATTLRVLRAWQR
jgi:hypothetical protein